MKINMSVSIVMTTFNGSKFILPQLASILAQTYPVDECIICDDVSADNTVEIVQNFIKTHQLQDKWKIIRNKENKGCTENFLQALSYATKDIIFFADQDDIWARKKIENMLQTFNKSDALAVYCLENAVDGNGNPIRSTLSKQKRIKNKRLLQEVSLSEKLRYARSPGHLLAFRRKLIPEIIAFVRGYQQPHDLPVGTIASIYKGYYVFNKELGSYRVHENNISSPILTPWASIKDFNRQITSRQLKYRELWGIKHLYWDKLSKQEQKELDDAIVLTRNAIIGLKTGKASKLLPLLFTRNKMMNRLLTVRNVLALLWRKYGK